MLISLRGEMVKRASFVGDHSFILMIVRYIAGRT